MTTSSTSVKDLADSVRERLANLGGPRPPTDLENLRILGNRDRICDEEHKQHFDRIAVIRERLRTGAYREEGAGRVTEELIQFQRDSKQRAEREAEARAKAIVKERLDERRERARRANYFAINDEAESSEQIMRRPSEKNPGFNDVYIPKGEVLFHEGQIADCVYLIDDGEIEIYSEAQDRSFAALENNEIFGEQAILFEGRRGASARALVDTRCLEVEGAKWREFLNKQTRPAILGFKALMLEQIQNNYVHAESNKPVRAKLGGPVTSRDRELLIPELYLFDPINPLELPEDRREHRHLHTLFSEIIYGSDEERSVVSTSASLHQVLQSSTGMIVTAGHIEFELNGYKFFGGPGTILGVAASMAGVNFELSVRIPDGVERVEYLPVEGHVCFAEIRRLRSTLVRFTRAIAMRCLGLKKLPVGMR